MEELFLTLALLNAGCRFWSSKNTLKWVRPDQDQSENLNLRDFGVTGVFLKAFIDLNKPVNEILASFPKQIWTSTNTGLFFLVTELLCCRVKI